MKKTPFLLILLLIFLSGAVLGAITYSVRSPADLYESTSTSVLFNLTLVSTGTEVNLPTDLYITQAGGGVNESTFVMNKTIYCNNNTQCYTTVTNFALGFYQWYVRIGENATEPVVTSSTGTTFDTSSGNISLNITYKVNGTVETCRPVLSNGSALPMANVTASINAVCNVTATNTTILTLTGQGYGEREYIRVDADNATNLVGLTIATTYGTQDNVTSNQRWFEVESSGNDTHFIWMNDSGNNIMTLEKTYGDLNITGRYNWKEISGYLTWNGTHLDYVGGNLSGIMDYVYPTSVNWNWSYSFLIANNDEYNWSYSLLIDRNDEWNWTYDYMLTKDTERNWTYAYLIDNDEEWNWSYSLLIDRNDEWNWTYDQVNANHADWNWTNEYVLDNDDNWNWTYLFIINNNANYNWSYAYLLANSYNWNYSLSYLYSLDDNINATYSAGVSNWSVIYDYVLDNDEEWNWSYSFLIANNANYNWSVTFLQTESATWNATTDYVYATDDNWNLSYNTVIANQSNWDNPDWNNITNAIDSVTNLTNNAGYITLANGSQIIVNASQLENNTWYEEGSLFNASQIENDTWVEDDSAASLASLVVSGEITGIINYSNIRNDSFPAGCPGSGVGQSFVTRLYNQSSVCVVPSFSSLNISTIVNDLGLISLLNGSQIIVNASQIENDTWYEEGSKIPASDVENLSSFNFGIIVQWNNISGRIENVSNLTNNLGYITMANETNCTADATCPLILYDSDFSSAGLMASDGAGAYSIVTDSSSNWNSAYTTVIANQSNWDAPSCANISDETTDLCVDLIEESELDTFAELNTQTGGVLLNSSDANNRYINWTNESDLIVARAGSWDGLDSPDNLPYTESAFNTSTDARISRNITVGHQITFNLGEKIDNIVDGWVRVTGNLNVTKNFTGNQIYGSLTGFNIADTTIAEATTYYNVENASKGLINGMSWGANAVNNSLIVNLSGVYHVTSQVSFSGTGNTEYDLSLGIDGTYNETCHAERKLGAAGDVGSASFTCFIALSAGNELTVMVANADGGNDMTVHNFQLTSMRIGG